MLESEKVLIEESARKENKLPSVWANAAERYRSDSGEWPPAAEGRPGMIIDDKLLLWIGPYMRKWPDDGWETPLRYTLPDGKPEIRSAGPDMKFDSEDDLTTR